MRLNLVRLYSLFYLTCNDPRQKILHKVTLNKDDTKLKNKLELKHKIYNSCKKITPAMLML